MLVLLMQVDNGATTKNMQTQQLKPATLDEVVITEELSLLQKRTLELVTTNNVLQAEITERKRVEAALRESEEKYPRLECRLLKQLEAPINRVGCVKAITINQCNEKFHCFHAPLIR